MKEKSAFEMHFRLAKLRIQLGRAMDEGDPDQIMLLSRQIDACQLALWQNEKKQKEQIG